MRLALIRHGQTDWNLAGRVQGHTDIPLNDTGRAQARAAAERIARELDQSGEEAWDAVVSSPLSRARETAQIIADALGLPLGDAHDGLAEQHFGEAEGLTVEEFTRRWPDRDFRGGESDEQIGRRSTVTLSQLHEAFPGARLLAVSHGALIRRTIATLTGYTYDDIPRIENASSSRLEHDPLPRSWRVATVSDVPVDLALRHLLGGTDQEYADSLHG